MPPPSRVRLGNSSRTCSASDRMEPVELETAQAEVVRQHAARELLETHRRTPAQHRGSLARVAHQQELLARAYERGIDPHPPGVIEARHPERELDELAYRAPLPARDHEVIGARR